MWLPWFYHVPKANSFLHTAYTSTELYQGVFTGRKNGKFLRETVYGVHRKSWKAIKHRTGVWVIESIWPFLGVCQYLPAHLVTFILLNESINVWSCQWNHYRDNIWSQDAVNYLNKAEVQISTVLKDENKFLKTLPSLLSRQTREGLLLYQCNCVDCYPASEFATMNSCSIVIQSTY